MKANIVTALMVMVVSFPAMSCPLGQGEMELTFSRVMQNFGRLLIRPDSVVRKSLGGPVTDLEIQEGLSAIQATISCADASLSDQSGKLLPAAGRQLSGDALKLYKTKYDKYMNEFKDLLIKYRDLFEKNLKTPSGNRDFSSGVILDRQIREKANESHQAI